MDVIIRQATADDFAALLAIWRAAVEATHGFLSPADIDGYEVIVATSLPRMRDLRVAETQTRSPAGFIAQDAGEIQMLFVDPAVHGQGVGTTLIEQVGEQFPVVAVDVNEQNPSGRRFYEARGFVRVGRSDLDDQGRPFPVLHLRRERAGR